MVEYLKNILPRIQNYSKRIDKQEVFVDKTWILYLEDRTLCTYRFLRTKKLLITLSGETTEWEWEFLQPNSIYLKKGSEGKIFRHAFVLDGLLIMQKEGSNDYVIFYNENALPDGDVVKYLANVMKQKLNLKNFNSDIYYSDPENLGVHVGAEVFDKSYSPIPDTSIRYGINELIIRDSKIKQHIKRSRFRTDQGEIEVLHTVNEDIRSGNEVFTSAGLAADGKYKITHGNLGYILVEGGKIKKVGRKNHFVVYIIIAIVGFILLIVAITTNNNNKTTYTPMSLSPVNDTTAYPVDAITFNEEDAKSKISKFIDAINNRNIVGIENYFSPILTNYYSKTNVSRYDAFNDLKAYWEGQPAYAKIIFSINDMIVVKQGDAFIVTTDVLERSTKGTYMVPYFYSYKLNIALDNNLQISSIKNEISSVIADIYQIFGIDETATYQDVQERNRKDDIEKVFYTIIRAVNNTPSLAKEYKVAAEVLYPRCVVDANGYTYGFSEFLQKIINGEIKSLTVVDVTSTTEGLKYVKVIF